MALLKQWRDMAYDQEAKKLGFTTIILPQVCREQIGAVEGVQLLGVRTVADAMGLVSGRQKEN